MKYKNHNFLQAIGLLLPLFIIFSNCDKKTNTQKVKIACNLPITGPLATYGEAVRDGVNLALDDLKQDLEREKLELDFDFQDNQGEAKNAVTILQKQALNSPDIYMSGITPQTLAIIDQVRQKKIPHILWSFTPLFLKKDDLNYRTWLSFGVEPPFYFKYIDDKKPKRVAIIYSNLAGAVKQMEEIVIPKLKSSGIEVYNESYDLDKIDFKDIAPKVKNFKPDVILIEGLKENMIGIIKDFRSYNLFHNDNVMFAFDLLDVAGFVDNNLINGLILTVPIFNSQANTSNIKAWNEKFIKKYNREPRYTDAYAYDMTYILFDAAKKVKASKVSWNDALLKTRLNGITGPLSFNQNGELNLSLEICKYQNGRLTPYSPKQ